MLLPIIIDSIFGFESIQLARRAETLVIVRVKYHIIPNDGNNGNSIEWKKGNVNEYKKKMKMKMMMESFVKGCKLNGKVAPIIYIMK